MKKLTFTICFLVFLFWGNILFAGYTIKQITDNSVMEVCAQVNDHDHVVWYDADYKVYLYDSVNITQLSSNETQSVCPSINNSGYVVWSGWSPGHDIYLYDGIITTKFGLSGDFTVADVYPQINNNGNIVWESFDGYDHNLYLYKGINRTLITSSICADDVYLWEEEHHFYPQLNDSGYVVWQQWDGNDYEIFLYNGSDITQLTDNTSYDNRPKINNSGTVVWSGQVGENLWAIFQYDGSSIVELMRTQSVASYVDINDKGYVVWQARDWHEETGSWGEDHIYLYNGCTITQVTDNLYGSSGPHINNNGSIVFWSGGISNIFLATPDPADSVSRCNVVLPWLMLLLGD